MMTDDVPFERDPALYDRWRSSTPPMSWVPDPLALAAYADGRLDEDEAAAIEAALAADTALLDDWLAVRAGIVDDGAPDDFIRRVEAAVGGQRSAELLPFERPSRRVAQFGGVIGWGALAASILVVGLLGFGLGFETQEAIDGPAGATSIDLLGPSGDVVG
jgi:anti-sigma factor RsiW